MSKKKSRLFACLVSDGTENDKLNRIVKITGISPTDSFAYDGENRRVYSSDSGLQFVNLYDIYGNLLSQYTPGSAFYKTDFVWANGEPRMKIDTLEIGLGPLAPPSNPESQFWYHTDHSGTPYVSTDSFKTVRWKISLDPFGERVSEQNPSTNNLRFPGQYFDRGSGLNYNWHRYYQPKVGRYYQTDKLLRKDGPVVSPNLYDYVGGNPFAFIDPRGTERLPRYSFQLPRFVPLIPNFSPSARECALKYRDIGRDIADRYRYLGTWEYGPYDAMRHCIASCIVAARCGQITSELAGHYNEATGSLLQYDFRGLVMDEKNNTSGRIIAFRATQQVINCSSEDYCENNCFGALARSELTWYTRNGIR